MPKCLKFEVEPDHTSPWMFWPRKSARDCDDLEPRVVGGWAMDLNHIRGAYQISGVGYPDIHYECLSNTNMCNEIK